MIANFLAWLGAIVPSGVPSTQLRPPSRLTRATWSLLHLVSPNSWPAKLTRIRMLSGVQIAIHR